MKNNIFTKISSVFKGNSAVNRKELERCVLCGALTDIPVSMPIEWRENYEIGCGQLCEECAKQRKATENVNTLSDAQIMLAVEKSRKEN